MARELSPEYIKRKKGAVLLFNDVSKTQQSFKKSCDIGAKIRKYSRTGMWGNNVPTESLKFGDFSNGIDFLTAQNKVARARQIFESLPSKVRMKFNNNPANLLDFVKDEKNIFVASELGLVSKKDLPKRPEFTRDENKEITNLSEVNAFQNKYGLPLFDSKGVPIQPPASR